jgi:hypothetical protein
MAYQASSPWHTTKYSADGERLSHFRIRAVPAGPDDPPYVIEPQYNHRPDLLAHDIYGSSKFWWIFAQRNMDVIEDPIYDFEVGVEIFLPKPADVKSVLG